MLSHFILFTYIAHIAFNAAGVTAMAVLHYRLKNPLTGPLLWVMGGLLGSITSTMIQYYFTANLTLSQQGLLMQYSINTLIVLTIYLGLMVLLKRLPSCPRWAAYAMTFGVLSIQFGRLIPLILGYNQFAAALRFPGVALISVYLFLLGGFFYYSAREIKEITLSSLFNKLGILTIIFAPASALYYYISYQVPSISRLHISLDFIYFSLWSLLVIHRLITLFNRPRTLLSEGEIGEDFIRFYKITPRETEVIKLLSTGLSNKEIADKMCVSFTTVRTHIYNIFQKTGAGSRVELLGMINNSQNP